MVMINLYVYREQFPLIFAYAVTIHKCQGLSLDCAINGIPVWPLWLCPGFVRYHVCAHM